MLLVVFVRFFADVLFVFLLWIFVMRFGFSSDVLVSSMDNILVLFSYFVCKV